VKICGITNRADAEMAIESGADALGFNVFPGSRRCIDLSSARSWIKGLPADVARVLIGVNPSLTQVHEWLSEQSFHAIQLHGETWRPFASRLLETRTPLIAAIPVQDDLSISQLDWFDGFAFLFDSYREGEFGGTGRSFAWEILRARRFGKPVIVAGGLTADNVFAAIRTVDPYAVDVTSGVESQPGKKDRAMVRDFIAAARAR
jgi:phosphoribosylanthranilate isomerase